MSNNSMNSYSYWAILFYWETTEFDYLKFFSPNIKSQFQNVIFKRLQIHYRRFCMKRVLFVVESPRRRPIEAQPDFFDLTLLFEKIFFFQFKN